MILAYDIATVVADRRLQPYTSNWTDPRIYAERGWKEEAEWQFSINHSSSSSHTYNQEALDKTRAMAGKLADLADTMEDMMSRVDEFEAAYQDRRALDRAEREREAAELQAKVDADTRIGERHAAHLVATWVVDCKHGTSYNRTVKRLRQRGTDVWLTLVIQQTGGGAVQFKLQHTVTKRADMIARLADFAEVTDQK